MKKLIIPVFVLIVSLSTAFGHSYNIQEFTLSTDSGDMMNLQIAGDYAVYPKMWMELYGYQLSTRQEFQIMQGGIIMERLGNRKMNSHYLIGGSMASPGLYGYDLDARQMFLIKAMDMMPMTIALSERYVYWADTADPMNPKLLGFDLIDRQEFLVRENFMDSMGLRAAGNYVIWSEDASTKGYGYDVATQETFLIAENGFFDSLSTVMNDRYLIYRDMDNLYAYDLPNRQSFIVTTEDVDMMSLKLTSHFVIWKETTTMKLWAYDLDAKQQHLITFSSTDPMLLANDNYVIWKDSMSDLHNFSLQTLQNQNINIQSDTMMFTLSGDYLFWSQYNAETMLTSIEGYDLATEQPFPVASTSSGSAYPPAAVGDYVIWSDMVDALSVLKGAQIFKLPNDLCTDAVSIVTDIPYDGTTLGSTGTDLSSCGFNDLYDVWNRYVPAAGGAVTISTDGSSFDTILSVYEGCNGKELACNDDYSLENPYSQVILNAVKGKTYLIRIAGFDGQQGAYKLLATHGVCANPPQSDTNNDCKVDMQDLAVLAAEWLHCGKSNPVDCW